MASLHLAEVAHDRVQPVDWRRARTSCGQHEGKVLPCIRRQVVSCNHIMGTGELNVTVRVRNILGSEQGPEPFDDQGPR